MTKVNTKIMSLECNKKPANAKVKTYMFVVVFQLYYCQLIGNCISTVYMCAFEIDLKGNILNNFYVCHAWN